MRIFLQYVLPLVLPTLVFAAWLALTRQQGESREQTLVRFQKGPWFWLALAGFALMAAGLAYYGLTQGEAPGGVYQAPRLEDGRIVPGRVR